MLLGILLLLIPIVISDLSAFKIPNIYMKYLFWLAGINIVLHGFGELSTILFALATLIFFGISGVGVGDLKLILGISLILNWRSDFAFSHFLITVLLWAGFHILISIGLNRCLPRTIALAPAIAAAFATYMVTRYSINLQE